MNTILEALALFVGLLVLSALAVAAAALAVSHAAFRIGELRDKRDGVVRGLYARELGRSLWSSAWWFPDANVKRALQLVGISLQMNGAYDVDRIREKWAEGDDADVSGLTAQAKESADVRAER